MIVRKPGRMEFWLRVRRESAEAYKRFKLPVPKKLRWYIDLMRGSECVNGATCLGSRASEKAAKSAGIKLLVALRKVYISIEP